MPDCPVDRYTGINGMKYSYPVGTSTASSIENVKTVCKFHTHNSNESMKEIERDSVKERKKCLCTHKE